jgi:protein involved in polysaccharide export with SLBB domain
MNNRNFRFYLSLIIIICALGYSRSYAQSLPKDLSSVNVDDLSDQQIKQLLQQAQSNGVSDAQIIQQAQSRGLPVNQASLLQSRIKEIRNKQSTTANNNNNGNNRDSSSTTVTGRQLNYQPDSLLTDTTKRKKDLFGNFEPEIFGANLFKNQNLSFTPNLKLATPINYIVGPDDQLDINVYGNSLVNWKLNVSPDGFINIPGVGMLNVSGKTIEQSTSLIKAKLAANNYAIGRGTSVQVSLGNIRSIKVILFGQVVKPGTYTLPSLATVFNALYSAGGPNENGSYREIEIIRNNRLYKKLDVYDFLTKGDQKNNINLQDQDIIRVPTYRTRVEMAGEVKIPALFEVLPGETFQDILTYAGGFNDRAYTARVKVTQISDQQRRITDVFEDDFKNYIPLRGDKYIIGRIIERYENRVTISGAVFRPGEYELQKGLTVSALIKNAAGLKEDAFTERGVITRLRTDNSTEALSFNIKNILNKTEPDVALQREDVVHIASIFDLRDKYTVSIKGEVRKPGLYAFSESLMVEDLIIKSGGFTEGASKKRIEVARRIDDSDPNSQNSAVAQVYTVNVDENFKNSDVKFLLKPFDIISVYSLPGYEKQKVIKVEGEVLYPGFYTIKNKNEKISDLVTRAGGLTASADVDGGTLQRSNIAILGVNKNKVDTAALARERIDRLNRLSLNFRDSTKAKDTVVLRNNYVGIDLKKILIKPGTNIDLLLEDGDVLRIPKQQQIVRVNGEVLFPSAVVYANGKSFKDYVINAGGFSPGAFKKGAYIVYPNGTVKGSRRFLFFNTRPSVKAGSEIFVPKKPVSRNNTAQEILAFTTGLASLGAIILGVLSLNK